MAGSLDLTDTDLSDLFDRYPDIKFDSTDDLIPGCDISENFSSPCSNATNHDATPTSKRNAASTAHTTPLRPIEGCSEDSDLPTVDIFLEGLDKADLPLMSKEGFGRLAREMTILAASLVPVDGDYYGNYVDSNKTKIHYQAQSILEQLKQANDKVTDEIDNIQWVRTRAPFMVEPAMQDLWCNYRQRAKLIAQYTALPCRTEKDMLEELTHIFDAYVYNPYLELLALEEVEGDIQDAINEIYDGLMTLLHTYNMWTKGMKDVKENQVQPLMRRMRQTPDVMREIAESEFDKIMAQASVGSPEGPGMQPADERTIQELNLSTSRRYAPIPRRARSRYRREHTV